MEQGKAFRNGQQIESTDVEGGAARVMLEQSKLDVTHKTRANLFNWRGQFTPELVEYLLGSYAAADAVIADPFAGSGTVLLESARRHLPCFGQEINPAAYAMSRFYTLCGLNRDARAELLDCFERQLNHSLRPVGALPLFTEGDTFREQHHNLIEFAADFFPTLERGHDRTIALNLLFLSEGQKGSDLAASLLTSLRYLRRAALALPFTPQPVAARLCDARQMHVHCFQPPSLILTSPPYINVFNYHQNYRALLEAVGWRMRTIAASEFGSNRKNRGNRFKTVVQYCLDMEEALRSFWLSLHDEGLLILIIGRESNVRGAAFYNGRIVGELLDALGGFTPINRQERKFLNKFGTTIFEDILVYRKSLPLTPYLQGRAVAERHLEAALLNAPEPVRQDIYAALAERDNVLPSPLFCAKDAWCCAENTT
jgi:hypothetical protein